MAHTHRLPNGKISGSGSKATTPKGQGHIHSVPGGKPTGSTPGTDSDSHTHSLPGGKKTGGPKKV